MCIYYLNMNYVLMQYTALYLACISGHSKCVELLISWGALVTYTYSFHGDRNTMSCLNAAIDSDHM